MVEEIKIKLFEQNVTLSSYVRRSGDKWLLCLHGIQGNKALFSSLLQNPDFNQYSFLCPDFIGFGKSGQPEDFTYSLQQQLEVIISLLDHLKINRVSVIGHSLGGMVGTMMLGEIPGRVSALCNTEGNLRIDTTSTTRKAVAVSRDEFESDFYPNLIRSLQDSEEPSAKMRLEALEMVSARVFYKTSQSIVEWADSGQLFDNFTKSATPKVLVFGQNGPFAPWVPRSNLPSDIPTAEISNASHFVLHDNPVQFEQILSNFLHSL